MELYLVHHGIKGQKWGIRRYQNPDGTLTEAGKKRYSDEIDVSRYESKRDTALSNAYSLNKLSYDYDRERYRRAKYNIRATKNMNKMLKRATQKGINVEDEKQLRSDKRVSKYSDKFLDNLGRQLASEAKMTKMKALTQKKVNDLLARNYNVTIEHVPSYYGIGTTENYYVGRNR